MTRKLSLLPGLLLGSIFSAQIASAQQQSTDELKKEIDELKESLKAIQKDIQDIKALLQSRQPAPPPQNVVLDLANNPFKGERTAKLTLVEFSDYQ
jgi:protein-disulfide isomerase